GPSSRSPVHTGPSAGPPGAICGASNRQRRSARAAPVSSRTTPAATRTRTTRRGTRGARIPFPYGSLPVLAIPDDDVERLVTIIADRVRARIGNDRGGARPLRDIPCDDDRAPGNDCATCGMCVVRRPWSVRAVEEAGASRVGAALGTGQPPADLAGMIDHTLLKADATRDDVRKLCEDARKHKFASVCLNTTWVPMAKALLQGTSVMVCAVVGFPLGAMSPTAKAYEAREAVRQGAQEIDMVINIGALKSRDYETVFEDICRVVKAAHPAKVKVILEMGALAQEEKIIGISLSKLA